MKATRVIITGKVACSIEEFDVPDRLEEHQIQVETLTSLISAGTEMAIYNGSHSGFRNPNDSFARYPFFPGYAPAGRLFASGLRFQASA